MFGVIKRDGAKTDFNLVKINDAIKKAFDATDVKYSEDIIDLLALRVTADFREGDVIEAYAMEEIKR